MNGKQLKNSILQWAIRGRLVPQDPADEPASVLLQRIRAEKARLVREGKLKKSAITDSVIFRGQDNKYYEKNGKTLTCIDEEIPFEIPETWEWVRLGNVVSTSIGKTPERGCQQYWSNGIYNWVAIADMVDGGFINSTKEKVSQIAADKCFGDITPAGSLIMSFKLTIGRTSILGCDAYHNEAIVTLRPYVDTSSAFRNYLLHIMPKIANTGDAKEAIKGKTLNSKSIFNLLFPLPPLPEQHRIVSKLEALMSVVERYEKAQDELDALCNSLNGRLRKSILQEAIQGRLVPQDPTDEPASVLLQRIRAEKARLVREGKLKKSAITDSVIFRGQDNKYYEKNGKTLTCIDEEIPFEIPETWEWVRLKHICFMQAGKNISASKIYDEKSEANPYRCVGGNGLRGYTSTFNAEGEFAIVGRQGALCGCLNMEVGKFYATEHAVVVNSFDIIPSRFIYYFFTALNLNQYATATAQPGLAVSNINEVFLPLPPLPEQHRIVSKVEEMFGVLDRLASR